MTVASQALFRSAVLTTKKSGITDIAGLKGKQVYGTFGITAFQNAQEAMIKVTLSLAQIAKMEALAKWGVEAKLLPKMPDVSKFVDTKIASALDKEAAAQGFDPKTVKITRA